MNTFQNFPKHRRMGVLRTLLVFLQTLHYKGSRFKVWILQFSCSYVSSLIVFNTNCLGT